MMQADSLRSQLDRIQQTALAIGLGGVGLTVVTFFMFGPAQFFQSYLLSYVFWIQLSLGGLGLLMIHNLTGGYWGFTIKRTLEASAMSLPVMILLFVPLIFGLETLYAWADAEQVAASELIQHKTPYLNVPFFLARTALYFLVWMGLAYFVTRWSRRQDETANPDLTRRSAILSGPGLVIFVLVGTFAAFDWSMSIEPKWFSSIYGAVFLVSSGLAMFCLAIIFNRFLARRSETLAKVATTDRFNDLGNLLLAFLALWAYTSFSQFLIIWSANLPEEIEWYLHRSEHGWAPVIAIIMIFHFAVPFLLLISRRAKRSRITLTSIAWLIILMRLVELFWLLMPAWRYQSFFVNPMDIILPITIGGFWMASFVWQLKNRSLVPLHDPRLKEAMSHHG